MPTFSMRVFVFVVAVAVCFAASNAQAPEPRLPETRSRPFFHLSAIKPPEPVTYAERSADKFQPLVHAAEGICLPCIAVNDIGQTATGISGLISDCRHSSKLQAYARSEWVDTAWAIMYAYLFPLPNNVIWHQVVVWINNPNATEQHVLSISTRNADGVYTSVDPSEANIMTGFRVHVTYDHNMLVTSEPPSGFGETPPLIMWHQLTDVARMALNDVNSFPTTENAPFNDQNFLPNLRKASPFG